MNSLRRQKPSDSLDLLLDTMCNTFGGIILLAVMVTLLSRPESPAKDSLDTTELLQRRLAQATVKLEQLRLEETELTVQASDPSRQKMTVLLNERAALREQLRAQSRAATNIAVVIPAANTSDAAARLQQLNAELAAAILDRATRKNGLDAANEARQNDERRLADLRNQVAQLQKEQIHQLRLPKEREPGLSPYPVIIKYGQVYPIFLDQQLNRAIFTVTERGPATQLDPLSGRGLAPERMAAGLRAQPSQWSRDRYYIAFYVFADSFSTFNTAKQAVVDMGYTYGWKPLEDNHPPLVFGANGSSPKAQ